MLWPVAGPVYSRGGGEACSIHERPETLLQALKASPMAALAVHSIPVVDVERLLLQARRMGWNGPWAADATWLTNHRWMERAFGKALKVKSWDAFLEDPWPAVGRGHIDHTMAHSLADEFGLNQLPGAMAVVENGVLVQFNDAFSSLVGITKDGLLALPISDFWSDAAMAQQFLLETLSSESQRELYAEAHWSRGDQRAISVELRCRVVGDSTESRMRWIIAVNDISRRERALEFMQLQRELVERASSAIVILEMGKDDAHPRIRSANPCWEQMSGYSMEETVGLDLTALDNAADVSSFSQTLSTAIQLGQSNFLTVPCKSRSGSDFWADVSLFPLDLAEPGVARFVAIIHDVSERVEAEKGLLEAMEAMEKANRAKSEFLQIVGHELRTPMNAILGFSELLRGAESKEEEDERLEMIEEGARNLLQVVNSVVDYIDLGSASPLEVSQPVELRDYFEDSICAYADAAQIAGLEFRTTFTDECLEAVQLPGQDYEKIIGYVLDNAVKFTSEGSVDFEVNCDVDKSMLCVTVSDTGIGLTKDEIDTLFQPFSASDMSTDRAHEGLGMGLALCSKLVEMYKGSITCTSRPGDGSAFIIRLPYEA